MHIILCVVCADVIRRDTFASMRYEDFKRNVGRAGLTVAELARLMHLHRNTLTNYAKVGEVPDHLALIVVLLGDMADKGLDFRSAFERVEFKPKKPRGSGFNVES